jgi:hypothetical protein
MPVTGNRAFATGSLAINQTSGERRENALHGVLRRDRREDETGFVGDGYGLEGQFFTAPQAVRGNIADAEEGLDDGFLDRGKVDAFEIVNETLLLIHVKKKFHIAVPLLIGLKYRLADAD